MSDDETEDPQVAEIRGWRDYARPHLGPNAERKWDSRTPEGIAEGNNRGWWKDIDTLLRALDECQGEAKAHA